MLASSRTTNILLILVLAAGIGIAAMLATSGRAGPLDPQGTPASTDSVRLPGTPISGQTTISAPGHYYLTRNITVPGAATAITITASNVSLDLGGFTIAGNDAVGSFGINVFGLVENVEIRHGTVRDFHFGLSTLGAAPARLVDVHAVSNVRGMQVDARTSLLDCTSTGNTETGIYLPNGAGLVRGCIVSFNAFDGISVSNFSTVVERSTIFANASADFNVYTNLRLGGGQHHIARENVIPGGSVRIESTQTAFVDNVCTNAIVIDTSSSPGSNIKAAPDHLNANC